MVDHLYSQAMSGEPFTVQHCNWIAYVNIGEDEFNVRPISATAMYTELNVLLEVLLDLGLTLMQVPIKDLVPIELWIDPDGVIAEAMSRLNFNSRGVAPW